MSPTYTVEYITVMPYLDSWGPRKRMSKRRMLAVALGLALLVVKR